MDAARTVRVFFCTEEVRSLMIELSIRDLMEEGALILTADELEHIKASLVQGLIARIDGPNCWFEYQIIDADAA